MIFDGIRGFYNNESLNTLQASRQGFKKDKYSIPYTA